MPLVQCLGNRNNILISFASFILVAQKPEGTPQSTWGILKSPDKASKMREQHSIPVTKNLDSTPAGRNNDPNLTGGNDGLRFSRVSFRLENEVFGGDEIEAEADREVEAITGADGETPGTYDEVGYSN